MRTSATTGRWSLPVELITQAFVGVTPRTMMWSIRAIGNLAGQVKPKPVAGRSLRRAESGGERGEAAVVRRTVEVAHHDHAGQFLVGDLPAEGLDRVVALVRR